MRKHLPSGFAVGIQEVVQESCDYPVSLIQQLGGSRVEHQTWGFEVKVLGRGRVIGVCDARSELRTPPALTKVKWAYSLPLRALLRNL